MLIVPKKRDQFFLQTIWFKKYKMDSDTNNNSTVHHYNVDEPIKLDFVLIYRYRLTALQHAICCQVPNPEQLSQQQCVTTFTTHVLPSLIKYDRQ